MFCIKKNYSGRKKMIPDGNLALHDGITCDAKTLDTVFRREMVILLGEPLTETARLDQVG